MRFNLERLNDAELLHMLSVDHSTYSADAIQCAKQLLKERGADFTPRAFSAGEREQYQEEHGGNTEQVESPGVGTALHAFRLILCIAVVSGVSRALMGYFS